MAGFAPTSPPSPYWDVFSLPLLKTFSSRCHPSPPFSFPSLQLLPRSFPSFSAALLTSKPHAAKLFDKIPHTEYSDENTFSVSPDVFLTGFSSSRQGKEEESENMKKSVEKLMMELGITPEEHELEALLRASVEAGRGEKVYHLLHKLRTIVRKVSPSTADAIDAWFRSSTAVRVGKRKWDNQAIKQAMENGGGGWHGLGWLGKGKWNVVRTRVDGEGVCLCCGEKLVSVDLDPVETESFAECVESIVIKKERNSNFEKFQKWLEYYGPFEAVIDAANVGLFNQRRFSMNKVNAVANGIRQKLPSKKWPLIIIHNKRLFGGKMNEPCNRKLIEKWKNADAIYETPTGSNDDWYWLYAAIKCKCLVVTNDEMRDHIFEALGNDFFAKWKEKHQVHFNHIDGSFQFIMPRPFSFVIQESERGHWHIPIAESEQGSSRSWMCVTRASSREISAATVNLFTDASGDSTTEITDLDAEALERLSSSFSSKDPQKRIKNSSQIFTPAVKSPKSQIISAIEDAEKIGGCIIDFEI